MTGLRLLAIGTDPALVRPADQAFGDAHQRQLKYAGILAEYRMIVRTLGGHDDGPAGRSARGEQDGHQSMHRGAG